MKKKVLLVGYPKSGITWLGYLLSYLLNAEYTQSHKLTCNLAYTKDKRVRNLTSGQLQNRKPTVYDAVIRTHDFPPTTAQLSRFSKLIDKVVLVVRDPREVAVSRYHYQKTFTENTRAGIGTLRLVTFSTTTKKWKTHTLAWLNESPHIVKYEDLRHDGCKTLKSLLNYLELETENDILEDALNQFDINKLRGDSKETYASHFFRKGIVGDHKQHFSVVDNLIYKIICQKAAERLGYK